MNFYQRLLVVIVTIAIVFGTLMLFAYDIIKLDWIVFMEIQPSYGAMEKPLPVADRSIPIQGAAYIPGQGIPDNPIEADAISLERGRLLFSVTCAQCHGPLGDGAGVIAGSLMFAPRDLTLPLVQDLPDGSIFLTVSNGIQANGVVHMPALNENLSVRDRWDVVNYVKSLEPVPAQ